jgi:hypothetical protein
MLQHITMVQSSKATRIGTKAPGSHMNPAEIDTTLAFHCLLTLQDNILMNTYDSLNDSTDVYSLQYKRR